MEVLIINPIPKGGICHYSYSLSQALFQKGLNFSLVTTKGENEIDYFSPKFPVERVLTPLTEEIFTKFFHYLKNKKAIIRLTKERKVKVIHFQWLLSARFDYKFIYRLQKMGIKVVYTAHNLLPHEFRISDKKVYRRIYQAVDKIIVHAQQNKKTLIELFNIPEKKIAVIPHGNYFSLREINPELTLIEARRILGLEKDDFYLLFFGNIRPYRGLDTLLKAMAYLRNIPQIKLIVAGDIKDEAICEDLVDLLRVRDSVNFYLTYIPLKYLGQYFYSADLVVLPYYQVYQSGAIQLAYAFHRPVISTRVGGIPEVVDEGKSGLLIPPGDERALAKAILKLYNLPREKLREMGEYAYNLAKTKFSWEKIAEDTINLYQND